MALKKLAIWLSWADFTEYYTDQMAKVISEHYQSTSTYLPRDWDEFDVLFSVPGPQQNAACTHKMVKMAWERPELSWAKEAAAMAVCSLPTLDIARKHGLNPTLLHWGVNPSHFDVKPLPNEGEIIVGWSGRYLNPRKRFPEVKATFDEISGISFFPALSDMYLGQQRGDYSLPEIYDGYYANIDVLVCGSLYEGFCFPMLEAAAAGRGIITFDLGIARDLQETGAGVIIVKSFDEMREVVLDADLAELGSKSAEAVREYWTWNALRDQWLEVFDKATRSSHASHNS